MTTRRARTERPARRRYQVTERDRSLVFAVGRMGAATSDQLRRLFFTEPSTAARRLAKCVALRLLDVHCCSQSEPNVYTLGAKGHELLVAQGADPAEFHRSRIGQHIDTHLRLLNDIRVEFVLAGRLRPDVAILAFRSDLDLRRASGATPPPYIPDAIVELELPTGPLALMVEVDTGTEGRTVFASKAFRTVAAWKSGEKCWGAQPGTWRPVAFVPSATRARALGRAIVEAGGGQLWLVTEFERVREQGAFGPVFAMADEVAATPRREPVSYRAALVSSREVAGW